MRIKTNLIFPTNEIIKKCGLDKGGKVQKHIDQFVLYHSDDYTPGKHINDSGRVGTKIGSGKVIWDSPDAHYLYEGKLMVDPITHKGAFFNPNYGFWSRPNTPKIYDPNGRKLEYHKGGKSGDHWFDRMIDNEMDDLLEEISKIVSDDK